MGAAGSQAHPRQQQQQRVQELMKQIKQLQVGWQNKVADVQQMGSRLPDGGAKVGGRWELGIAKLLFAAWHGLLCLLVVVAFVFACCQLPALSGGSVVKADINSAEIWHCTAASAALPRACAGLQLAARADLLQAELGKAQAELRQLDPDAAAALEAAAPVAAAAPTSNKPPASQPAARQPGVGSNGLGSLLPPQQQSQQPIQQQPHQQQQQRWQQRQPPPPPQRPQEQQYWPQQPPPPPPPRPQAADAGWRPPQLQQWQGSSAGVPPGNREQQQSTPPQPQPQEQQQKQQERLRPSPPGAQTLDGQNPSYAQLKQRKHVLKKALQREDRERDQLKEHGREYPANKQQLRSQMYAEYKECKEILQALQEADEYAAEQCQEVQVAGVCSSSRRQLGSSDVIDLT
jgi:hypothetical protein